MTLKQLILAISATGIIVAFWMLSVLVNVAAQENVNIQIFVDKDTLVLFIPGNQMVSLQGLGFEVVISDIRKTIYLDQYVSFQAIRFEAVPAPVCFRLARYGTARPLPLDCDSNHTATQLLTDADVFWFDSVTNETRTFQLVNNSAPIDFCAAGQPHCSIVYIPPTFTPIPTIDRLLAALDRAQNFDGSNENWEPFVHTFDGVDMVLVPTGCFEMGSTDEEREAAFQQCENSRGTGKCPHDWFEAESPPHRVCFDEPFWIDRTEVTSGQFAAFNGQAENSSAFSGDDRPREQITWTEAQAFCESRDARLPTEAEWEYAARGPEAWRYPWGNEFDGSKVIWNRSSSEGPAPVASVLAGASWVGAVDMSGNVWEWVADWYNSAYYGTLVDGVVNPTGPTSGSYREIRGGSWGNDETFNLRTASRSSLSPNNSSSVGFRCARFR